MRKGTKNLTLKQRLLLSQYLDEGLSKKTIALKMNICLATVYNEIGRGMVNGRYSPEFANSQYLKKKKNVGAPSALLANPALALKLSYLILEKNLSPENARKELMKSGIKCPTKTTLYKYIDKGLIPNVTKQDLHNKTTTMFSHGLIQIPAWVREENGWEDGDMFNIEFLNNCLIITKVTSD